MKIEFLFANHFHTITNDRNPNYRPIVLKCGMKIATQRIVAFYKKNELDNIYSNEDYNEIYGECYPFEYSCHLVADGSKTIVYVMIYNNQGRRKMKYFKTFMSMLREELTDLIDKA